MTGLNKRRMVQRAVMEELVKLVDSGTRPYQMKKGGYIQKRWIHVCVYMYMWVAWRECAWAQY